MNNKDKEAFEKWFGGSYLKDDVDWVAESAWQAACEYARDEFKFQTPPAVVAYQEMNDKLQAENAKLKKVLCFYANGYASEVDDSCNSYFKNGHIRLSSGKRARQCLKELDEKL